MIDILLSRLQEAWNLGIAICVDESMIKYMGRYVAFVQFMPNKPIKHGIKVYALCCSRSGVLYNFKVYTGKSGTTVGTPKALIDVLIRENPLHRQLLHKLGGDEACL